MDSTKRNWIERAIFLAIIAGFGIWMAVTRLSGAPRLILVDNRPIAAVESRAAAKSVLEHVRFGRAAGVPGKAIRFAQRVSVRRAGEDADLVDVPEAVRALEDAVTVEAELYAIVVDDKPLAALVDKEHAEEALRLTKKQYERRIRNLYSQSSFKEQVFISRRYVEIEKLCSSPDEATRVLTTITEKPTIHTVVAGDRAVHIAPRYGVSLADLKKLNPQADLDRLIEGDQLLIRRPRPPVTVISKALVTRAIDITPPPEARRYGYARTGKRQVRMVVTFENGEPVLEEIVSQVTTWDRPAKTPISTGRRRRR